jgi:hypothetical protein
MLPRAYIAATSADVFSAVPESIALNPTPQPAQASSTSLESDHSQEKQHIYHEPSHLRKNRPSTVGNS